MLQEAILEFIRDPDSHDFEDLYDQARRFAAAGTGDLAAIAEASRRAAWFRSCLGALVRPPILDLSAPVDPEDPDSRASPIGWLSAQERGTETLSPLRLRGLDAKSTRGFLAARQRDRQPILVVASTSMIDQLIASLERFDLRFRLSPTSVLVEAIDLEVTASHDQSRERFEAISDYLAIPVERVVRLLEIPQVTTPLLTTVLQEGSSEAFVAPHWVRFTVLDPATDRLLEASGSGELHIVDLSNLGRALEVQTGIRGDLVPDGFRLAEPR
jgi:hypothetical protein